MPRMGWMVLVIGIFAAASTTAALAQEQAQAEKPDDSGGISPDLPPSAYAKGERPAPIERVYEERRGKVWTALLKLLEEEGVHVLSLDRDAGTIQTALKSFDGKKDAFTDVATRPPLLKKEWPIWQPPHLYQGRYSLEILVLPDDHTRVSIRAYLEGQARHALKQARFWAERFSNGTIENYFLGRLDQALD